MKIGWKKVIIIFSYEPQSEMKRKEIYEKASQFRALDYGESTPDRIRTCDLQLRRLLLYPAELPGHTLNFDAEFKIVY